MPGLPRLDDKVPFAIRSLAYSHLAATMMRKEHTLSDVQAPLILAVWGLMPNGKGPDPWVLTGHCQRKGQRLGLHKAGSLPAIASATAWDAGQITDPVAVEALDKALMQWKTSLSCFQSVLVSPNFKIGMKRS